MEFPVFIGLTQHKTKVQPGVGEGEISSELEFCRVVWQFVFNLGVLYGIVVSL